MKKKKRPGKKVLDIRILIGEMNRAYYAGTTTRKVLNQILKELKEEETDRRMREYWESFKKR